MNRSLFVFLILCMIGLTACYQYEPFPRPLGFHRIETPAPADRKYDTFEAANCPFRFDVPAGGEITRYMPDSCWVDINFPTYDIKWHISYRNAAETQKSRSVHFEEYRRLIYKHAQKASRIAENPVKGPDGFGVMFEIYGHVGTPTQIFYSDNSGQHIAMMSMYYRTAMKNDSLLPVTNYMKEELAHMIETLEWK